MRIYAECSNCGKSLKTVTGDSNNFIVEPCPECSDTTKTSQLADGLTIFHLSRKGYELCMKMKKTKLPYTNSGD